MGQGKSVGPERLNDKEVARLKCAALAAGVRGDPSNIERAFQFSGHSLRDGLASSAEVDECYVHKPVAHASAEMTHAINGDAIASQQSSRTASPGPLSRITNGTYLVQPVAMSVSTTKLPDDELPE